jgi:AcrR family transcriptional regulator
LSPDGPSGRLREVSSGGAADKPAKGLRERKKARTRAAIQRQALRLFREQGYDQTTVEQIAAETEVSESTFFRYFPTKEEVVLWDAFDPLLIKAFRAQPPELSPARALRAAFKEVFGGLSAEQMDEERERMDLILTVPELRSATLDQFVEMVPLISEMVAERTGRPVDDLAVRTFSGAAIGVAFSVMLAAADMTSDAPAPDVIALLDAGFALLEAGLPL